MSFITKVTNCKLPASRGSITNTGPRLFLLSSSQQKHASMWFCTAHTDRFWRAPFAILHDAFVFQSILVSSSFVSFYHKFLGTRSLIECCASTSEIFIFGNLVLLRNSFVLWVYMLLVFPCLFSMLHPSFVRTLTSPPEK